MLWPQMYVRLAGATNNSFLWRSIWPHVLRQKMCFCPGLSCGVGPGLPVYTLSGWQWWMVCHVVYWARSSPAVHRITFTCPSVLMALLCHADIYWPTLTGIRIYKKTGQIRPCVMTNWRRWLVKQSPELHNTTADQLDLITLSNHLMYLYLTKNQTITIFTLVSNLKDSWEWTFSGNNFSTLNQTLPGIGYGPAICCVTESSSDIKWYYDNLFTIKL